MWTTNRSILSTAAAALVALGASSGLRAEEGGCGGDGTRPPAAGHWKGTFKFSYQLSIAGLPASLSATTTSEGQLSFDLARHELEDPPAPPPPPPPQPEPKRKPLRPPSKEGAPDPTPPDRAAPGQFASDQEQVDAYWREYDARQARLEAEGAKRLAEYLAKLPPPHAYVAKDDKPKIRGTTEATIKATIDATAPSGTGRGNVQSTAPVTFDLEAEEQDSVEGFKHIRVMGEPGKTPFSGSVEVRGPGGSATGRVSSPGGKGSGPSGGGPDAPDAKGRIEVFVLDVLLTDCAHMQGVVDLGPLKRRLVAKIPGATVKVLSSDWSAKLDEKDEEYERKVDALADEPIPANAPVPWIEAYSEDFKKRSEEIRASAAPLSDYKHCVLKRLARKWIRINLRLIEALAKRFPKVDESTTCHEIGEASRRIVVLAMTLQLYGSADCPEVAAADAAMAQAFQDYAKAVLGRKHTLEELQCLEGADKTGSLGDTTDAYRAAYIFALGERLAKLPPPKPIPNPGDAPTPER